MSSYSLLVLDLRAPLSYRGVENPPLAGLPQGGDVPLPCPDGAIRVVAIGSALEEGDEELFLFDSDELVSFDPDDGPRLAAAIPPARFYGRAARGPACAGCSAPCAPAAQTASGDIDGAREIAGPEWRLPAGRYLFMQWRPANEAELADGIEWFARESWWEGRSGLGPYIVRRLKEDGKLATQILRATDEGGAEGSR
jgi:hypothetical protein